jgi:DNA recombination protein RmuC
MVGMLLLLAVSFALGGLLVGLVLGNAGVAARLLGRAQPEIATAATVEMAMEQVVAQLDQRSINVTQDAVNAAVSKVLEVNRAHAEAQSREGSMRVEAQAQAGERELTAKKDLIESRLSQVQSELRAELSKVTDLVGQLGSRSTEQFGRVSAQLNEHAAFTSQLASSTQQLKEVLASTKARGQWGERMAEDVLRLAGLVEHVNYEKQISLEDGSGIPDFTFLLPKGHKLFMDVKFPMSAYLRFLEADTDSDRTLYRKQFLADVRVRVKELANRDYAAKEGKALDEVLLFIPNETISSFLHEHEPSLFEDAMRNHIVMCSPLTLFAMLGVIRQAYDNFMVEQQADQILELMGAFGLQYSKYTASVTKLGRNFDSVHRSFEELESTRRNALERPLRKIEQLRQSRGLACPPLDLTEVPELRAVPD